MGVKHRPACLGPTCPCSKKKGGDICCLEGFWGFFPSHTNTTKKFPKSYKHKVRLIGKCSTSSSWWSQKISASILFPRIGIMKLTHESKAKLSSPQDKKSSRKAQSRHRAETEQSVEITTVIPSTHLQAAESSPHWLTYGNSCGSLHTFPVPQPLHGGNKVGS